MDNSLGGLMAKVMRCITWLRYHIFRLQALARLLAEEHGVRDLGDDIRDVRAELPAQLVVGRLGVFVSRARESPSPSCGILPP